MAACRLASHLLLTKYMLLVLCVHLCAALDYYSFYAGLAVKDIATTLPLSTLCQCHNACRAMVSCTAATHVREPGSEPKCLISETLGIYNTDLESANVDTHTTVIKEYQVKFVGKRQDFTGAKQACLDMGMRLATPSNAASRDLLAKIHKKRFPNDRGRWVYWVDATRVDNTWTWGDEVEDTDEPTMDAVGAVGAVDAVNAEGAVDAVDAVAIPASTSSGGCGQVAVVLGFKLKDEDCSSHKFAFICTL